MQQPWYQAWFNTDLYYRIYANRNNREAFILSELLSKLIPNSTYPNVLDLACGRGRHAIHLAQKNYQVTGVDLADNALKTAQERAMSLNLQNIQFQQADMRLLSQKPELPTPFDAVINVFTSFGYFDHQTNQKVIQEVAKVTRKEGCFVLDYLNPNHVESNLVREEEGEYFELNLHYKIKRWIDNQIVYKQINLNDTQGNSHSFTEEVHLYSRNWFEQSFEKAGFALKNSFGNYHGGVYDAAGSPRQIHVGYKIK